MQFVVFEKFTGAYLHQIAQEIPSLLVNNLHDKRILEGEDGRNFGSALFVICTRVKTWHSCFMKTAFFSANQTRVISHE